MCVGFYYPKQLQKRYTTDEKQQITPSAKVPSSNAIPYEPIFSIVSCFTIFLLFFESDYSFYFLKIVAVIY